MKTFIIEAIICCAVFTALVVPLVKAKPLAWIADYPPKIIARAKELGLISEIESILTPKVFLRKMLGAVIFGTLLAFITIHFNGATTFIEAFAISYGLWFIVAWYDAFVIDILWFCHSKKIIIKGTEDMVDEYHNYWFHIKMSCVGSLIGLPVALIAGLIVMFIK